VLAAISNRGGVIARSSARRWSWTPEDAAMITGFLVNKVSRRCSACSTEGYARLTRAPAGRFWAPAIGSANAQSAAREDAVDLSACPIGGRFTTSSARCVGRIANFDDLDPLCGRAVGALDHGAPRYAAPADADLGDPAGTKSYPRRSRISARSRVGHSTYMPMCGARRGAGEFAAATNAWAGLSRIRRA